MFPHKKPLPESIQVAVTFDILHNILIIRSLQSIFM